MSREAVVLELPNRAIRAAKSRFDAALQTLIEALEADWGAVDDDIAERFEDLVARAASALQNEAAGLTLAKVVARRAGREYE